QIGSTSWSFTVQNGATGDKTIFSPGLDSQYCMLSIISGVSPKPMWYDAYLINATARLGQDTLYTLSFYAKIHYDPSHPILTRPVTVYVEQFQNYVGSFSATQTIDTGWKKYTFDFRAKAGGLQRLYLGIGDQMGDVMFDAVAIKRKEEYGLFAGEGSATASIVRIKFGESDLLPRQRVRDLALFYDSLQSDYFDAMKKCIADTLGASVLVNNYAPEWWGSLQDIYANRLSDFTQAHVNTDYPRQRSSGIPWSDSTWVMSNNSILQDANNGTMGYLASASIDGKPFVGRYMNLVMNQNCAAQIPFLTSYASLQDWDGLFFVNYANYYEDLFADVARQNIWWSIAGNPSLLVQMPVASDAFRNQRILPSTTHVTITHDADDVLLESVPGHYSGPMGVEGFLDPNIGTLYQLRQQFDSPKHKVAAEYPYIQDTSTKVSETDELSWSQSGGYMLANASGFKGAAGIFGTDTVTVGSMRFRRLDNSSDMQSIMLAQLDNSGMLLTVAGRSQNFGAIWQYGDSSIGNHWGKAPTIMSAEKLEFFIDSDSNRLIAHPLDSTGNILSGDIEGVREPGTNTFKIVIDQSVSRTPWFYVQGKNNSSSVAPELLQSTNLGVFPNPAQNEAHIRFTLPSSGLTTISLYDDLGREIASIVNGELYQGSYEVPINLRDINPGHYVVRIELHGKVLTRSLNIVK
ncbi:MAG: T9SS type A sorting domain-containing protein, partial [Bacteroidota bacterium]|nr:T9SS type A sorting domain-containing protein [Bacteroidota bacterium]